MPLGWDIPAQAQLEGGSVRPAILLRIATDPVIRLWTGAVRDLAIDVDAVETDPTAIYQSMGLMTNAPAVNQLINGAAERVEFTLSGVAISGEIAALASTEAGAIRNVDVNLGFLVFDANWQVASPTAWPWDGVADSLTVERQGSGQTAIRSLKLSVGSLMTGRRQPKISYQTDPDQKRRSADDDFYDPERRYSVGTTKVWPR